MFYSAATFIFNMSVSMDLGFLTIDIKLLATFGLLMAAAFMVYSIYHFVWDRLLWAGINSSDKRFLSKVPEQHKEFKESN